MGKYPPHNVDWQEGLIKSVIRGLRNGIVCGVRIRLPYVIQSVAYAVIFRESKLVDRVKFVLKQGVHHGRNLGLFVLIYKTICWICRQVGIIGGVESWIAGFVGGFIGFGDSTGISGSVNNQIVLYLFARGLEGALRTFVKNGYLPQKLDVKSSFGFRCFAGFSLALILYMTEYQSDMLNPGFMSTMNNLYYESESGSMLPKDLMKFAPIMLLVGFTLVAQLYSPNFTLEKVLAYIK